MPGVPKGCPCNASFRWFKAGAPVDTVFDGACERVALITRFIKGGGVILRLREYVKRKMILWKGKSVNKT